MDPIKQTQPRLEHADGFDLTAISVLNPAVALIGVEPALSVLIARHVAVESDMTRLLGVRHVRLPTGVWQHLFRLVSWVYKVRIADEFEYPEVQMVQLTPRSHIAQVPRGSTLGRRAVPFPIAPLTAAEYQQMMTVNGHTLRSWITDLFRVSIANWNTEKPTAGGSDLRAA
jgi:hypothetical protein